MASAVFFRILLVVFSLSAAGFAQRGEGDLNPAQPAGITPEQIIQKFAAREKEFAQAREAYTFRQDVTVQTLDGDTVDGEYKQVVDVTFDDKGRRRENVIFSPQPSLQHIEMTKEDFDDIQHRYAFVLTTDDLPTYQILYVGQQRLDEIDTYVFDIAPKSIAKEQRFFQGRIWVDNHDFQIVKSEGKPVGYSKPNKKTEEEQQFPTFTTYREQIDGKYWFPTYARADQEMHFPGSRKTPPSDVHIRIRVRYTDYKRFASKSRIIYNGEEVKPDQTPPNPPKK